jgi:methylmalonyl-CoA carboxyltransferase large subunit
MEKRQSTIDPHIDSEELRNLEQHVASLAANVERLQQEMAKQSSVLAELSRRFMESVRETEAPPASAQPSAARQKPVPPEVLVVIAAAVSAFLGKKIRIRSARMLQSPYEIVNPWSQQGRVSVQASHSLHWER